VISCADSVVLSSPAETSDRPSISHVGTHVTGSGANADAFIDPPNPTHTAAATTRLPAKTPKRRAGVLQKILLMLSLSPLLWLPETAPATRAVTIALTNVHYKPRRL
jgi:hypothetical protein